MVISLIVISKNEVECQLKMAKNQQNFVGMNFSLTLKIWQRACAPKRSRGGKRMPLLKAPQCSAKCTPAHSSPGWFCWSTTNLKSPVLKKMILSEHVQRDSLNLLQQKFKEVLSQATWNPQYDCTSVMTTKCSVVFGGMLNWCLHNDFYKVVFNGSQLLRSLFFHCFLLSYLVLSRSSLCCLNFFLYCLPAQGRLPF